MILPFCVEQDNSICKVNKSKPNMFIRTYLGTGEHDVVHLGKCTNMIYSIMFTERTLTNLSVYCLFYYVVWLDFVPVNFAFVYQYLPMDSENDLYFQFCLLKSNQIKSNQLLFKVGNAHLKEKKLFTRLYSINNNNKLYI